MKAKSVWTLRDLRRYYSVPTRRNALYVRSGPALALDQGFLSTTLVVPAGVVAKFGRDVLKIIDHLGSKLGWDYAFGKEENVTQEEERQEQSDGDQSESGPGTTQRGGAQDEDGVASSESQDSDGEDSDPTGNQEGDAQSGSATAGGDEQPEKAAAAQAAGDDPEPENPDGTKNPPRQRQAGSNPPRRGDALNDPRRGGTPQGVDTYGGIHLSQEKLQSSRTARRLAKAILRLAHKELGPQGDPTPRIEGKKLIRELASRSVRMARIRKEELGEPGSLILTVDASGSCSSFSNELWAAAVAASQKDERIIPILNSNGGIPEPWERVLVKNRAKTVVWLGDDDGCNTRRSIKESGIRLVFFDNFGASHGPYWVGEDHIRGVGHADGVLIALNMILKGGKA